MPNDNGLNADDIQADNESDDNLNITLRGKVRRISAIVNYTSRVGWFIVVHGRRYAIKQVEANSFDLTDRM